MPFKLSIRSNSDPSASDSFSYDQPVVTIGRKSGRSVGEIGHLYLPDEQRVLSRVHVRIEQQDGVYRISDLSENGTWLEDEPLKRGQWYPLTNNNEIRLGEYVLTFTSEISSVEETRAVRRTDLLAIADRLVKTLGQLRQTYSDYNPETLQREFRNELAQELKRLSGVEAIECFALVKARVRHSGPRWASLILTDSWYYEEVLDSACQREGADQAFEALTFLKHNLAESAPSFRDEDILKFTTQLRQVVLVLLDGLLGMLKGRKEFAEGFDAEVTRYMRADKNPIKFKQTSAALAGYLLSWQDKGGSQKAVSDLDAAIRDLEMHQLASLTALRDVMQHAYTTLLSRFKPEAIRETAREALPGALRPFLPVACWKGFQRTYENEKDIGLHVWSKAVEDQFVEKYLQSHSEQQHSNGEE